MAKGVSGLQNIQLLKWCLELGIEVSWNLLWGFPGETAAMYAETVAFLPLLHHLQPPMAAGTIRLDRFSPNFFDAERLGFANVQPYPAYHYVYPLEATAVANLAYYFSFEYQRPKM